MWPPVPFLRCSLSSCVPRLRSAALSLPQPAPFLTPFLTFSRRRPGRARACRNGTRAHAGGGDIITTPTPVRDGGRLACRPYPSPAPICTQECNFCYIYK